MTRYSYPNDPVVLVDDETDFLTTASFILKAAGISNLVCFSDNREVIPFVRDNRVSVVVVDMIMPYCSGSDLMAEILCVRPEVSVIVISAVNEAEAAAQCIKEGAVDYLLKPVEEDRLVATIRRAIVQREIKVEAEMLKRTLLEGRVGCPQAFSGILTQSPAMQSIFQYVEAIAPTALPVLITGPTGVGKELMAEAVHRVSSRKGKFVAVNVSGIDKSMLADTLFGHVKGAFTGADTVRSGLIEQASGGTLFLDEIGDLDPDGQIKLLRLIQDQQYYPVGSDIPKTSDARIVVATNQTLALSVERGTFRKDLFFRLQAHTVAVPPLSERKEDLQLLVPAFTRQAAERMGKPTPAIPPGLLSLLRTYHFPGNIRELQGMIYDAVGRCTGTRLSIDTFKGKIGVTVSPPESSACSADALFRRQPTLPTLKETEQSLIAEALARAGGNITLAAALLGMTRQALSNRINREKR